MMFDTAPALAATPAWVLALALSAGCSPATGKADQDSVTIDAGGAVHGGGAAFAGGVGSSGSGTTGVNAGSATGGTAGSAPSGAGAGAAGGGAPSTGGAIAGSGGTSAAQDCEPHLLPSLSGSEPVCLAPDLPCDTQGSASRLARHQAYLSIAQQGNVDFLLLGDFLCDDFRGDEGAFETTKQVYDDAFGAYRPANFCQGGDMTEHVLWRIQNGELDGIQPKVVMLHVGTTNGGRNDEPARILAGVKAIIDYTLQKLPGVRILLIPVLPWGSGDVNARHTSVNELLPLLDDCGKTVRFVDIYPQFLGPNGTLPMPAELTRDDGVHLTAAGYRVWADAIREPLAEMMR